MNQNETIVMVLVGLLFSLSAGVRITLPLLALNVLARALYGRATARIAGTP